MPVQCTIVTGALNVGKTTFISSLLQQRPANEKWAVLVNEFGACGVDGAILEAAGSGVVVREISGGCMCCAVSGPLTAVIAQLLRQTKPDRLLVEPSGLGHPAGLIDILQGEHLKSAITLHAVICLVDVREGPQLALSCPEVFLDQINISDVIVGSKDDLASEEERAKFHAWAATLWPPKAQVVAAARGSMEGVVQLLQLPRDAASHQSFFRTVPSQRRRGQQQQAAGSPAAGAGRGSPPLPLADNNSLQDPESRPHSHTDTGRQATASGTLSEMKQDTMAKPQPHDPLCSVNAPPDAVGHIACGWLFHVSDVFDRQRLIQVLCEVRPHVLRLKGIFRVGPKTWVTPEFLEPPCTSDNELTLGVERQQQQAQGDSVSAVRGNDETMAGCSVGQPAGVTAARSNAWQCKLVPISYRRDSRIELIAADAKPNPHGPASVAPVKCLHVDVAATLREHAWGGLQRLFVSALC